MTAGSIRHVEHRGDMPDSEEFEHESIQDNETVGAYLESLIEGFRKGEIVLTSDNRRIELFPNNVLHFDLSARKKGQKSKLTIKLSWRDSSPNEPDNGDISIT